jgi:hypothetical protein
MTSPDETDRKLRARLLLGARRDGDYLVLSDEVISGAIKGARRLTPAESAALQASPLTLRRLRQLSIDLKRGTTQAANDPVWRGSAGMLRSASGHAPVAELSTDDGWFRLHFVDQDGVWRVILALDAAAPFAARLLREQPMLRVVDGGGAIALQGRLDADGECEAVWPFETPPTAHFHLFGATFAVEPIHEPARG